MVITTLLVAGATLSFWQAGRTITRAMREDVFRGAVAFSARRAGVAPAQLDQRIVEALRHAAGQIPLRRLPVIWLGAKCWER